MNMLNIILYSEKCFKSLSPKILTLYIGILFVGLIDIFDTLFKNAGGLFTGKPIENILANAAAILLLIIVIGFIDVVAFSIPLFDVLAFFRKIGKLNKIDEELNEDDEVFRENLTEAVKKEEENLDLDSLMVRFMKVYIVSHIAVSAVQLIFWYFNTFTAASSLLWFRDAYEVYMYFITILWFVAIVTRGSLAVLDINNRLAIMTFITIFSWYYILSIALFYLREMLFMAFFKI